MKFLAIVIAVLVELYVLHVQNMRMFGWLVRWTDFVMGKIQKIPGGDGRIGVLIIILPLLLPFLYIDLTVLHYAENSLAFKLLALAIYSVVLIYCMGPKDPIRLVDDYLTAVQNGDNRAAQNSAEQLVNHVISEPIEEYALHLKRILLIKFNDNIVGVIFWFVIAGPTGAILFRLTCELKERFEQSQDGLARACVELYHIVSWIPARICAMVYAFAGSFIDTVSNWSKVSDLWLANSDTLLVRSGMGSVGDVHEEDEEQSPLQGLANLLSMVKRAVTILIVLLALMVVVGWFSGI